MAKLKPYLIVLVLVLLALIVFYSFIDSGKIKVQRSIFGRNIYNSDFIAGEIADPNYEMIFPKDHAEHPTFDIEWWYLTANLQDEIGNDYGLQWTLFRFKNLNLLPVNQDLEDAKNMWNNEQMYMAHASFHSLDSHWFAEKLARGGVGNAGVNTMPFSAYIDGWEWSNTVNNKNLFPSILTFTANQQSNSVNQDSKTTISALFNLKQSGPSVTHGENGYSVKSTGLHASHYYSAPFIDIQGEINISNAVNSIQLSGKAWFDHEWTSQLLDEKTEGWDWLSLHLDDGSKIMVFRMRLNDMDDFITGTYITAAGISSVLNADEISLIQKETTLVSNRNLPLNWELNVPKQNLSIKIQALKPQQWNEATVPYYEGMVGITGSHSGKGFIELTGY